MPTPGRRLSFPKEVRLRRRKEFLRVQEKGQKIDAGLLLALVLKNQQPLADLRVGLTVSAKVGNAVVRNRVRRRLRELFRTRREALPKGLDMVLIARTSAAKAEWQDFVRAFDRLEAQLQRRYGG